MLQLAGAAALLLWSVRLVRTGVERAFAVHLRRWLRRSSENRAMSAGTGAAAALALQSSTAVAMLVATFAASGALTAPAGLAMLLGADVGSAIAARVLSFDLSWLIPTALLAGTLMFLRGQRRTVRQTGRILMGLALILVSLSMIRTATAPLRDSEALSAVMHYLEGDAVSAFAIGALVAWGLHSSIAAILLFVALAGEAIVPLSAAVALVLGANLGGALIPVVLTWRSKITTRRIVTANAAIRGGGAIILLSALQFTGFDLGLLGASVGHKVVNLHVAFNLLLAAIALPLVPLALRTATAVLPEPDAAAQALTRLSALDPAALSEPPRAIGCATREVLRIGEQVEAMLGTVIGLFRVWDDGVADQIRAAEDDIDRMYFETKLYLARLHRGTLDEETAKRSMDLATIAINLEGAGDAISRNMLLMARKMHDRGISFSDAGWREISDFHDRVLSNLQLALNVLMTGETEPARQLVEDKEQVREIEADLQRRHLDRLRAGETESIETSNMHQETLRSLKQVNTAAAMIGYPILQETGDLLSSRLTETEEQG